MLDDSRLMKKIEPARSGEPPRATKIQVRFVDPLVGSEWDKLVSQHPDAHIFHGAAWARVLAWTYGHKPFYFVATQGEEIVALLPLMEVRSRLSGSRGVSLPFSDFCPPLLFGDAGSEKVVAAAVELGRDRGWKYLEIRGSTAKATQASDSASYFVHTLDLRHSERDLFEGCASSTRRALRKAEKSVLAVGFENSLNALAEFYRLHCQTRRNHGLPPPPWAFFKRIHAEILKTGNGCVVIARQQSKPIAAAVFFRRGKHALYKFGASDASAATVRANNLVMWEGIKFWARAGAEFLHFGRTDLDHGGLRRFKRSWGAMERGVQYMRFDFRKELWMLAQTESGGFHHHIFRHLPLPVNRVTGALIYPHLD